MADIWYKIEHGIVNENGYTPGLQKIVEDYKGYEDPYASVLVATIVQAGKDAKGRGKHGKSAKAFLCSEAFTGCCEVIGLSPYYVMSLFKSAWAS